MSVVRSSKFRHVFGKIVRAEDQYLNVQCTASAPDSNLCDANSKYFCLPWRGGGGPFVVWDLKKTGRLPQDVPLCTGHSGTVQDLHFHPFADEIVASASDDTTAKVWKVPVGGPTTDIEQPEVSLEGHYKKVILVRWNPVASNILSTVSFDNTIKIWDVESGKERLSFDSHPDAIQSFNWNYNGSLYGTYCKDKLIRLVDPRNNAVADTFQGHAGTKAARVCFLGNRNMFCSIGFSKQSERQIFFWDARDTSKALTEVQIDVASGTLLPFFDTDTSMLYLAGKGDTNIRYFEIDDEPPYQYFVANFVGKEPQRGLACVPKRGLETGNCEIMRFLRLTRNGLEPVSFSVPRKGDQFQSDLYPDTFAGRPSLSAAEWFKGGNAQPIMMSLNPKDVGSAIRAVVKDDTTSISPGTVPSVGAGAGPGGGGGGLDAASAARLKQLESKVAALEDENRRLRSGADEAAILKQQVEELKAKNDVLERQIAKMG